MGLEVLRRTVASERLYGVDHLPRPHVPPAAPAEAWLCVRAAPAEFEGPSGELLERMLAALRLPPERVRREATTSTPPPALVRAVLVLEADPVPSAPAESPPRVATYAPSRLIAEPSLKARAWADLKRVMEILGLPVP